MMCSQITNLEIRVKIFYLTKVLNKLHKKLEHLLNRTMHLKINSRKWLKKRGLPKTGTFMTFFFFLIKTKKSVFKKNDFLRKCMFTFLKNVFIVLEHRSADPSSFWKLPDSQQVLLKTYHSTWVVLCVCQHMINTQFRSSVTFWDHGYFLVSIHNQLILPLSVVTTACTGQKQKKKKKK